MNAQSLTSLRLDLFLKKENIMKYKLLAVMLLCTCLISHKAYSDTFIIGVNPKPGISPSFNETAEVMLQLKPGDRFRFYNLDNLSLVSSINVPKDKPSYKNKRIFIEKFSKEFENIKKFVKKIPLEKKERGFFLLPEFLHEVSKHEISTSDKTHILIIGDGIYNDTREPQFSMTNQRFPTDGHLNSDIRKSIFSTKNKHGYLKNTNISFVFTNTWETDIHHDRVNRFWDLFISSQSGRLVAFTQNMDTGLRKFLSKNTSVTSTNTLDMSDRDISMIKIKRSIAKKTDETNIFDGIGWLKDGVPIFNGLPDKFIGELKIGIRWKCKSCDYDLWVKSDKENNWLFFNNKKTTDGFFNKDYLNSPDNANALEYVQIENKIDIRKLNIKVNLYSGSLFNDRHGEVRAYLNGRVYSTPFKTKALIGNQGANHNTPETDSHWFVVDVKKLFNLQVND